MSSVRGDQKGERTVIGRASISKGTEILRKKKTTEGSKIIIILLRKNLVFR